VRSPADFNRFKPIAIALALEQPPIFKFQRAWQMRQLSPPRLDLRTKFYFIHFGTTHHPNMLASQQISFDWFALETALEFSAGRCPLVPLWILVHRNDCPHI
jgi:hypothetical protein